MNAVVRFLFRCFDGVVIGVCTAFLALVGALTTVFLLGVEIVLPGVIQISRTTENGAIALNFVPQPFGIGVGALVIAVAYVVVRMLAGRDSHRARLQAQIPG